MREGPPDEVLTGAFRWRPVVAAWKGTVLLSEAVPVVSGRLSADVTQHVPERLTFTVPEWAPDPDHPDGMSWVPDREDHPLAEFGQYIDVDIHIWSAVTAGSDIDEPTSITRLGRYKIQSWDHDDLAHTVQVECVGLLQVPADARFRTPQVPRPTGTLVSEFRRLMVAGIPVDVDAGLTDRAIPKSFVWDEDRLGALYDIADAWPARLRVDQFGVVNLLPTVPDIPVPVLSFTDGQLGTLISAPRSGTRDSIANVVVARSTVTDDPAKPPLQAVAEVMDGPLRPSVYGEVTFFWSSPLATTQAQLQASANTILVRKSRPALVRRVRCVPDPRVELDDPVSLTGDGSTDTGYVVAYSLPLTVGDGEMTIDVGVH